MIRKGVAMQPLGITEEGWPIRNCSVLDLVEYTADLSILNKTFQIYTMTNVDTNASWFGCIEGRKLKVM